MATTPADTELNEVRPPARFISLSARAGEVFANREKALAWLQTPNPSLQDRSPIEAADTEWVAQQRSAVLSVPSVILLRFQHR